MHHFEKVNGSDIAFFVVSACNLRRQRLECVGHVNRTFCFTGATDVLLYKAKLLKADGRFNNPTPLTGIREGSLSLILLCLLCLVITYLSRRDSLQTSAFNGSLTLNFTLFKGIIHQSVKWNVCDSLH